ncbi:MAG: arginine--tRNA ligase [Desulfatirhabdiaceae bacterium]
MKTELKTILTEAIHSAFQAGELSACDIPDIEVEVPRQSEHGDFSTNIAMVLASRLRTKPRSLADIIVRHLNDSAGIIEKTTIAGPGFINFHLHAHTWIRLIQHIHEKAGAYGASNIGNGKRIQIEFVSSNPTGPLHVGHGRGAAVGDSVANILSYCGYDVQKEYYINDSGRQIQTLGRSVFLRYQELLGETVFFPEDCYQGEYIRDIALKIQQEKGDSLLDENDEHAITFCARYAAAIILEGMKQDLIQFGVTFDNWFSEQSLYDSGEVDKAIDRFRQRGIIYEKEGALWFNTTAHGDEKDRVVVRQNGQTTYFASDIAYHYNKFNRGFETVIDVWGADHHGYIPRIAAAIESDGHRRDQFQVILVQLVNLLRAGVQVAMSTRAGEFVTLKDVMDEVGTDAARFIFLTRHYDSPLDFDLDLARKKSNENPVYYVQYVHARICSMFRKAADIGIQDVSWDDGALKVLNTPEDIQIIRHIARYPEIVRMSATHLEPHRITYFLMELAAAFHAYYNKQRVITEDVVETRMRLILMWAIRQVIRNGLALLGVSAPESM